MSRLFGTSGIRGNLDKVSPELAMNLGLSLATLLGNKGTVAIGHDVRLSSPLLGRSLSSGLMSGGCNVDQLGYVPTPILAFTTRNRKLAAGVMITGSHNPPSDNGLKCYTGEGRDYTSDEEAPLEDHILKNRTDAFLGTESEHRALQRECWTNTARQFWIQLNDVRERYTSLWTAPTV